MKPALIALSLFIFGCAAETAAPDPVAMDPAILEAEVVSVAEIFGRAIAGHDSTLAASVLSDGATILEGGSIESKEGYLSHHFHSDAAFIGAIERESISREVSLRGDAAWVVSKSRLHGSYRDRDIDMTSIETLVLEKASGGWTIASVHWSSGRGG